MLARWLRTWDARILKPFVVLMAQCGVRPNTVTIASLAIVAISGFFVSQGYLAVGACILLTGGLLDAVDGELARFLRTDSPLGGFLDSISDHCGDFSVYLGLLWFSLTRNMTTDVILIFVASFGSLFASQVRSRATMAGIDTKDIGLFTRCERILLLALGLLTDKVTVALWLLATLNNVSAAQRLIYVVHATRSSHN
jgi:CDP-diacylglycerol---glycerol-3-phosphate 3-phosphatidyltransferase